MTDKIKPQHLERKAILYVRQSSTYQVNNNLESQKLQYAMQERLRHLGWQDIDIVDDDLGRSAAGTVTRAGLERMLPKSVWGRWAQLPPARCHASHATVESGNDWWRCAGWWILYSSIKKWSIRRAKVMIDYCWD